MFQIPSKPITLDEFLHLPETRPASEYINGHIIQKPIPQGQHSRIQQKIISAINVITEDRQAPYTLICNDFSIDRRATFRLAHSTLTSMCGGYSTPTTVRISQFCAPPPRYL